MNQDERLCESLSAFIDGEASELETHRLLKQSQENDEVRQTSFRYHLIGEAMRHETHQFSSIDISSAVSAAIKEEPALQASSESGAEKTMVGRWLQPLASVAVAASVAFAVVVGVQVFQTEQIEQPGQQLAVTDQERAAETNAKYTAPAFNTGPQLASSPQAVTPVSVVQQSAVNSPRLFPQQTIDQATQTRIQSYLMQHAEHSTLTNGQGILPFARVDKFETQ
ncbi:sigma-E factor negative regulatory protein [Endozoicomonas sp. SM1973]|uniref:Sigma-E factor negative regulatory protein n=1 Tax=Spartinivicinus marinus TaxID=2994442 RepID=A0A853I1G6_9GAMM|nr:sigma-E factor negative regulatory protein [Spartinivicinus marinus]MCX4025499.1 sigma-E factor negative regulatory protein [Spartinivicinus marinus]NYZ65272.1 sigma-E factor negative regulatory protein [Spartinivicinus marinus]